MRNHLIESMWTLTNTYTPPIHIAVFVNSAMHVLSFIYWTHTQRHQCSVLFLSSQRLKSIWNIYIFFKSVFNQKINNISIFPKCAFILSISFTLFLFHFVWNIEMRASNRSFELIGWFRQCFFIFLTSKRFWHPHARCVRLWMCVCVIFFFFSCRSDEQTTWQYSEVFDTIFPLKIPYLLIGGRYIRTQTVCKKKNTDLENNMHTHTRTLDDLFLCLFQFFIRFLLVFCFSLSTIICVFHLSSFHSRYHLCEFIL